MDIAYEIFSKITKIGAKQCFKSLGRKRKFLGESGKNISNYYQFRMIIIQHIFHQKNFQNFFCPSQKDTTYNSILMDSVKYAYC